MRDLSVSFTSIFDGSTEKLPTTQSTLTAVVEEVFRVMTRVNIAVLCVSVSTFSRYKSCSQSILLLAVNVNVAISLDDDKAAL